MNKQDLLRRCDYFNLVHGVTLRAISAFSDDELAFRPAPTMRSPRELVFHTYIQEKLLAEGVSQGRVSPEAAAASNPETEPAAGECARLTTVRDLRAFAEACHRLADTLYRAIPESELGRSIESPFGTYTAPQYFSFAYDEHWHHRGQLYTYLRLLGKEPPMLYGYE